MSDLSPCPFCGSTRLGCGVDGTGMLVVQCEACDVSGPPGRDSDEARDSWNKRSAKPSPAPAYGTVRVVRRYEVWSDGAYRPMDPSEADVRTTRVVAGVTLTAHVVTVTSDLPLPPAPVVVVGAVETS